MMQRCQQETTEAVKANTVKVVQAAIVPAACLRPDRGSGGEEDSGTEPFPAAEALCVSPGCRLQQVFKIQTH